jgi:DNA-binding Lrp family transcriptional regulator
MNPRLDKFDLAILRELQADGRLSNAELAARVGLSAAPCWRRVRALEEAIRRIPEIIACHYISGTDTFEPQVVSRDLASFSAFARDVLLNLPNVKDVHTSFSLGEVKADGALPLDAAGA